MDIDFQPLLLHAKFEIHAFYRSWEIAFITKLNFSYFSEKYRKITENLDMQAIMSNSHAMIQNCLYW